MRVHTSAPPLETLGMASLMRLRACALRCCGTESSKSRLMKSQPRHQALSTKRLVTTGMVRPERRTRWVGIEFSRGTGLTESPEADGTGLRPSPGRVPYMPPPERADAAPE